MADLFFICEICGTVLDESHCKARCPNCGRMLDCGDLPVLQADGKIEVVDGKNVFVPRPATSLATQQDKAAPVAKPIPDRKASP